MSRNASRNGPRTSGPLVMRMPIRGIRRCAWIGSGHDSEAGATVAPSSARNSRRFIPIPLSGSRRRLHAQLLCRFADTLPRAFRDGNARGFAFGADRIAALAGKHDLVHAFGARKAGDGGAEPLGFPQEFA